MEPWLRSFCIGENSYMIIAMRGEVDEKQWCICYNLFGFKYN